MEVWECAVREICSMPALLWLALQDIRHLSITRAGVLAVSGILIFGGCFGMVDWQSRLGGAAVGVILLLFCYFSKEAIGIADGVTILACGVAFGLYETATLCFFAALYAGGISGVLLLAKKVGRKSRIPFMPFLLLGYITMRVLVSSV